MQITSTDLVLNINNISYETPEPETLVVLSSGLLALGGALRRRLNFWPNAICANDNRSQLAPVFFGGRANIDIQMRRIGVWNVPSLAESEQSTVE